MNAEAMSTEDFRNRLFDLLKDKGRVGKLQSQLRNDIVVDLRNIGLNRTFTGGRDPNGESLPLKAVNSLVADHLRQAQYDYSLSVFLPESGMAQDKLLTTKDLLQLLRVSPQSKLYLKLTDFSTRQSEGFLWKLIAELAAINSRPTLENGTQTERSRLPCASIEEEFHKVDTYYSSLEDGGSSARAAAVEERILAYQRNLEERSRSELQMAISRFKDNEMARLRIEERENCRKEIDKSRREMEQTYRAKYDALIERERNAAERIQKQQEMIEKENFAQRQSLLEEIESLKQREVQLRRQEEVNNREKYLTEERLRSLEELARRREENARRAELEVEQRIHNEVNKFKVEEQARYFERLKNLEFREDKVKDNEKKVGEEMQDHTDLKVEVREKRSKVDELETELIRVKHDLIAAQKQNEMLGERSREMANYQMLKEDNAVLRRELDNAKTRTSELMRDVMVERQKHEDILRELGHVASKPTPEVAILRKQVEQLQTSLRTECSLAEHAKQQMEQRHEAQVDDYKQLLMKFQEQSWKQKEMNWEARDLRQQLLGRDQALGMKPSDTFSRSDSPCNLIDGASRSHLPRLGDPSLYQDVVDPHLLFDSPHSPVRFSVDATTPTPSDDYSFSSDLVRDMKKRLRKIDSETEKLDRWYQDRQLYVTSVLPVLGPEPNPLRSRTREDATTMRDEREQYKKGVKEIRLDSDATDEQGQVTSSPAREPARVTDIREPFRRGLDIREPVKSSNVKEHVRSSELREPVRTVDSREPVKQSNGRASVKHASDRESVKHSNSREAAEIPFIKEPGRDSETRQTGMSSDITEPTRHASARETVKPSDVGEPVANQDVKERDSVDSEFLKISLDDAWKSAISSDKREKDGNANAMRQKEAGDARYEEELGKRREERERQEEETWKREQDALAELKRQGSNPTGSFNLSSSKEMKVQPTQKGEAREASEASKEPAIDPELRKYMEIVQKKRDEEKKKSKKDSPATKARDIEEESEATSVEVSAPEDKSEAEEVAREESGDDSW